VLCLDRDALAAQVQVWLRRDQIDNRISIVVRPGPGDSQGAVSFFILRDGKPIVERRLPRVEVACEPLRAAVGLAIAISVETMRVTAAEEPHPSPAGEPVLDLVPDRLPDEPKPESNDDGRFSFSLWLLGAPALLPRPAVGLSPEFSARVVAPFELDASIMGTNPVHTPIGSGSGEMSLIAGRLDACVATYHRLLGSRVCLGAAVGRLVADGAGYMVSYAPRLTWVGTMARLEGSLKVSSGFRIAIGLDGILPLVVPRLEVRSPEGAVVASTTLPQFGAMFFAGPQVGF
jgi:hypothetical protein